VNQLTSDTHMYATLESAVKIASSNTRLSLDIFTTTLKQHCNRNSARGNNTKKQHKYCTTQQCSHHSYQPPAM